MANTCDYFVIGRISNFKLRLQLEHTVERKFEKCEYNQSSINYTYMPILFRSEFMDGI
jgi:hypothetical protein